MTSASELFYSRRFRPAREPEPAIRSPAVDADRGRERERERDHHHCLSRLQRSNRLHHHDGCSLRHLVRGGHSHLCRNFGLGVPHTEHEVLRQDGQGTSRSSAGTSGNREIPSPSNVLSSFSRGDRLPGAVLQARARLLERLRGVSLSGTTRQSTATGGGEEFSAMDWDADPPPSSSFIYSTTREAEARKPPGLTAEAVGSLPREVYGCPGGAAAGPPETPPECCICLERFQKGDSLLPLPCGHRFHGECLSPWLRDRGDCPYCRSRIVANDPAAHVTSSGVPS